VQYYAGDWDSIQAVLPDFELTPFTTGQDEPVNPFLQMAATKSDVSQGMSFIATHRNNAEERVIWQAGISRLWEPLCTSAGQAG